MITLPVTLKTWFDKFLDIQWIQDRTPSKPQEPENKEKKSKEEPALDVSFVEEEEDPIVVTAENYIKAMIQQQVLHEHQTFVSETDRSFQVLSALVSTIIKKNKMVLRNMVGWREVNFMEFMKSVREIFEVREGTTPKYSWTRVAAMYAYAVVLAERDQENMYRIRKILDWFSLSFKFYTLEYVRDSGGWDGLIQEHDANYKPRGGSVFLMGFGIFASIIASALAFFKLR